MTNIDEKRSVVQAALKALGIERLVLGIHDASFPGLEHEDIGRGSPYSYGGRAFLRFAADLGFTGIQLGPQGRTSPINASPYDGTLFAKSPLSVALGPLVDDDRWAGLLSMKALARAVQERSANGDLRVDHAQVLDTQQHALRTVYATFAKQRGERVALSQAFLTFTREHSDWLEDDGLFEALAAHHGTLDWQRWPEFDSDLSDARLWTPRLGEEEVCARRRAEVARSHAETIEFSNFCQFLLHAQHVALREELADLGLKIYGDLQVGVSHRDLWRHQKIFLGAYRMGAPPSRTNPAGQPWGYPVLDPDGYGTTEAGYGPGLRFVAARLGKMLSEFDGLRIDHPHGLVCPWVYRADDPYPLHAVQHGARLFASPDLPDHPDLARYSLVSRDDLAPHANYPRYEDDWVRQLTDEQTSRHGIIFDVLVKTMLARGGQIGDIACEVLSTCPSPLAAVLARYGLGRFRVIQKADPANINDPYRTARAAPTDWVMLGTHDTPPMWRAFEYVHSNERRAEWARYLADRLEPDVDARPVYAERLSRDPVLFKRALCADLFVGPARNVSIFFADLLGMKEIYNRPGEVHPENWTLRIPPDYAQTYRSRCETGDAFDLPTALAMALRARHSPENNPHTALIAELERRVGA